MQDKVSYSDDYINRLTKRKQFRAGWYQTMTTGALCEESRSGNVQFIWNETPLRTPGDPSSKAKQSVRHYVVTPMMPEDAPDHEPPESAVGMTMRALRAKGIELPEFPRKQENGSYALDGETITREQANEARSTAIRSLLERCEEFRGNPDEFEGYTCYSFIDVDGDWNRIKTMKTELPEGASLVPPELWFTKDESSGS